MSLPTLAEKKRGILFRFEKKKNKKGSAPTSLWLRGERPQEKKIRTEVLHGVYSSFLVGLLKKAESFYTHRWTERDKKRKSRRRRRKGQVFALVNSLDRWNITLHARCYTHSYLYRRSCVLCVILFSLFFFIREIRFQVEGLPLEVWGIV